MDKAKIIQKLRRNMLKMEELLNKIEKEGPDEFWLNGTVQLARDIQEDLLIYRFLSNQQVPSSVVPGIPVSQTNLQAFETPKPPQNTHKPKAENLEQVQATPESHIHSSEPAVKSEVPMEEKQDSAPKRSDTKNDPVPSAIDEETTSPSKPETNPKPEQTPKSSPSAAEGSDLAPGIGLSFNDKAAYQTGGSLADKLKQAKGKDLKKSMPLHEKFRYINELFEGDNGPFNELLERLNACQGWPDAEALLKQTQLERSWSFEDAATQAFYELIYQKFA